MRNAVLSACAGKIMWAGLLACFLQLGLTQAVSDESPLPSKAGDDNPQMDDMSKRDWNKNLKMWGKRGWENLHGGWAVKRSAPTWGDQLYAPPIVEKRAWQRLQTGWGKRLSPDDDYTLQKLASMIEEEMAPRYTEYGSDNDLEPNDDEKRNWRQFSDGWGKRSKWDKFRGSWGKRDPAWSNLKGIWGKRSFEDQ